MEKEFLYCGKNVPRNKRRWNSFRPRTSLLAMVATSCCFLPASSRAQSYALGATPGVAPANNGFHIGEVNVSAGYASINGPAGFLAGQTYDGWSASASASLGYSYNNPNGTFTINYTPSITSVFRYSAKWFDENLRLAWTRRVGQAWTYQVTGSAGENSVEDFLFVPVGGAIPSSTDIYTPSMVNPTQALLFGTRVLVFNAGAGVTYSPSKRLHISIDGRGDQIQSRPNPSEPAVVLVPRTRSEEAYVVVGYSTSPKTEFGVDASYLEAQSLMGHYRASNAGLFVARKVGMNWFLDASGFASTISSIGQGQAQASLPFSVTYGVGASARYQFHANSFSVNYRRSAGDSYGFGALSTTSYSGIWNWRSRARTWSFQAAADRQQIEGGVAGGINLLDGNLTVSRALSRRVALGLGGSYLRETLPAGLVAGETQAFVARLTLSWIPFLRDTPPLTTAVDQPIQDR
jgi:hypothetical protein